MRIGEGGSSGRGTADLLVGPDGTRMFPPTPPAPQGGRYPPPGGTRMPPMREEIRALGSPLHLWGSPTERPLSKRRTGLGPGMASKRIQAPPPPA